MKSLPGLWLITILLIVLCYCFVDRPLCEIIALKHHQLQSAAGDASPLAILQRSVASPNPNWSKMMDWPPLVSSLSPLLLLPLAFMNKGRTRDLLLLMSVSIMATFILKNELKAILGRDWPISWCSTNPSWIKDHAFGFHFLKGSFLQGGDAVGSFPSGHTAIAFATFLPLGLIYRRLLPWCVLIASAEGGALVMLNYHFPSDVLAGALLGTTCTLLTQSVLELSNGNTDRSETALSAAIKAP
jgi:membrane-associated phospholipid phosphatase